MSQILYNRAGIAVPPAIQGFMFGLRTIFTSTGNNAYTPAQYCKLIFFQVQSAGGGGKNCANSSANQIVLGGGGSGGIYGELIVYAAKGSYNIAVGAGGSGASGAAGGASSVTGPNFTSDGSGAFVWATASGGGGGGTLATGTSSLFIVPLTGAATYSSLMGLAVGNGRPANESYRHSGTLARSGRGADSLFGAGGQARITHGVGNAGGKGAGGGGGMSVNAGGAVNGGAGGDGIVIAWEYF